MVCYQAWKGRFSVAIWLGLGLLTVTGRSQEAPAEAFVSLEIPNLQTTWQKWIKTTQYKWSQSPDMAAFRQELVAKNLPSLMNPQAFLGFDETLLGKFAARALYYTVPASGDQTDTAFIIQTKDSALVQECLKSASTHFATRKWKPSEPKIAGAKCVAYTGPKTDEDVPQRLYVETPNFFAVATSEDMAKRIVTGFKSKLAETADYQEATAGAKKLAGEAAADASWFVRPIEWIKHSKPKPNPDGKSTTDVAKIMQEQKFEKLKAIASVVTIQGVNGEPEQAFSVLAPPPYEMGMRMLQWQAGKMPAIPKLLPAKFASLTIYNSDPVVAFEGYGNWFDVFSKTKGAHQLTLDASKEAGVDMIADYIANLNPITIQIIDYGGPREKFSPQGKRTLRYQTIRPGQAVRIVAALTKLYPPTSPAAAKKKKPDQVITHDKIGDWTVWTIGPGGNLSIGGKDKRMQRVECQAVAGDVLVSSSDGKWLREILAGKLGGLSDDPRFIAASAQWKKWETSDTSYRTYNDQRLSLAVAYQGLLTGDKELADEQESRMLRTMLAGDPQNKYPEIYKKLPPFAKVAQFHVPSITSIQSNTKGMLGRIAAMTMP